MSWKEIKEKNKEIEKFINEQWRIFVFTVVVALVSLLTVVYYTYKMI